MLNDEIGNIRYLLIIIFGVLILLLLLFIGYLVFVYGFFRIFIWIYGVVMMNLKILILYNSFEE